MRRMGRPFGGVHLIIGRPNMAEHILFSLCSLRLGATSTGKKDEQMATWELPGRWDLAEALRR